MSTIACLVLLALLGAVCSGAVVRESPPEPHYDGCTVKGKYYNHGTGIDDPCDRCYCLDGNGYCNRSFCYVDGELVPTPV